MASGHNAEANRPIAPATIKKKRRLAKQTAASLSTSKRLAVMHANNDPLGVRSDSVSGSDAEGRPFEVTSLPDRLSSSSRITILGTTLRSCREVIAPPVDKIALRGKEVTESARRISLVQSEIR